MAQLRGGDQLFVLGTSYGNAAKSNNADVGAAPNVALFISNAHGSIDCTFRVEASGAANPLAGRNVMDGSADAGLSWFDYQVVKSDGTTTDLILAVGHGDDLCFDLSPFAPQYLRLVRTDSNGANN